MSFEIQQLLRPAASRARSAGIPKPNDAAFAQAFADLLEGEDLVEEPFQRLIKKQQLFAYKHRGFWSAMDTFKDKITFDRMYARGDAPWEIWRNQANYPDGH